MKKAFFITGTDTNVGKTWASIALMNYYKRQGLSVMGFKPVAAGCDWVDGQLKNEDAMLLQENSSLPLDYEKINPFAFEAPVSPHIAAGDVSVNLGSIVQIFCELEKKVDVVVVEGAGGWLAPLNHEQDVADLAIALQIPVIMVVAIRLGCINHARLTFQAIQQSGVSCRGWLAMCVDPEMLRQTENIETIKNNISVPLLGVLPYVENVDFEMLGTKINLDKIS